MSPQIEPAARPVAEHGRARVSARLKWLIAKAQGLKMKALRRTEDFLLAVGLALFLIYVSACIHGAVLYHAGLWSFTALQSTPSPVRAGGQRPGVDFSLWSGKRIRAYAQALATKLGAPLAVLSIRKLQLQVPVFDGTDELTLNRGAGRIVGTGKPGEFGNIGIAGHRDGFFRRLKDIRMGDRIELAVLHRKFVYTVDNITVVNPGDVRVLQDRRQPSLTLVTCYPFYFVGDAPQRYIVQASLAASVDDKGSALSSEFPKPNKEKTQ